MTVEDASLVTDDADASLVSDDAATDDTVVTDDVIPGDKPDNDDTDGVKTQDGDADKGKPEGAPDEYEDFKVADGVELTEEQVNDIKATAKELDLSQEKAQALVDREVAARKEESESQLQVWRDQNNEWKKAARTDKEFGGEKFDESVVAAKAALRRFGNSELSQVLDDYGMGNHPEVIRFLVKVGNSMKEDSMHNGVGGEQAPTDIADILYPNQGK
jgi:hypothetical protein